MLLCWNSAGADAVGSSRNVFGRFRVPELIRKLSSYCADGGTSDPHSQHDSGLPGGVTSSGFHSRKDPAKVQCLM